MRDFFAEIYRRDRVLALVGWLNVGLFAVMLAIAPFDHRVVMGINPWIKPMKFAFSIAVYLWTLAWFVVYLPGPRWAVRIVRWGASIAMIAEIICITTQAARGTTSHYNVSTPFNFFVFQVMAVMILVNTLVAALVLFLFSAQRTALPSAYLWGIRLGLLLLLLGSTEGMVMILRYAHTVGLPDGGPGLPLVNWSTKVGDLRIAHLLGLHAAQILPLAGFAISRWKPQLSAARQMTLLFAFAAVYTAAGIAFFLQALHGRPLIAL